MGESVFILYNIKVSWLDAIGLCRMFGFRLAMIKSNSEARVIAKAMIRSRPSNYIVFIRKIIQY